MEDEEEDEESEALLSTELAQEEDAVMNAVEIETEVEVGVLRERDRVEGISVVTKVRAKFMLYFFTSNFCTSAHLLQRLYISRMRSAVH